MLELIKEYFLNDTKDKYEKYRTFFQLVVISCISILVFLNIFGNSFVIDDPEVFLRWPAVKNMDVPSLLQGSYPTKFQGKVYRPVKGLMQAVDYQIWQTEPFGYHLQAIFLNLSIAIVIYFIIRSLTKKSSIAFIASLLFAIHPVHTEAITFMTASVDTWGILFFFLAFYFYLKTERLKRYYFLSFLFASIAFFTYEMTLIFPVIVIIYDLLFKKLNRQNVKEKSIFYSLCFIIVIFFFYLRIHFIGHVQEGGYFAGSFYLTMLTMTKAVLKYLELLILPVNLSINPTLSGGIQSFINNFTNLDPIRMQKITDFDILFSISVITGLITAAILLIRKTPIISFSIFFIFIALSPVLNILPQKIVMAERYEYIASFGGVLLFAYIFNYLYTLENRIVPKQIVRNILIVFLIFIVIFFSFLTLRRNTDWKDDLSVWSALASQSVGGAIGNYYTGMLHLEKGENDEAIANFKEVIRKKGDINLAYYFLTYAYLNKSDLSKANEYYQKLVKVANASNKASLENLKKEIDKLENQRAAELSKYNNFKSNSLSFYYPKEWKEDEISNGVKIYDKGFSIELFPGSFKGLSKEDYLNAQKQVLGTLINQGPAKIPNVDYAFVKIWKDNSSQKMEFFIFKGGKVIRIVVGPSDSLKMKEFNSIISTLKFY